MLCKIRNILCLAAAAALWGVYPAVPTWAQGVVTLAEGSGAGQEEINKDIPDETSLFDVNGTFEDIVPPAPAVPPIQKNVPAVSEVSENSVQAVPAANTAVNADISVADEAAPVMPRELLAQPGAGIGVLGTNMPAAPNMDDIGEIDEKVFSQMSDLEKQTALLNLQLRREKVQNEIEAIKNQRKLAAQQEQEKEEAKKREKLEWEKAQEQKVIQEQQKLRELDISFEKLRQEKLLNSYKNKMLADTQKWVDTSAAIYEKIENEIKEKQELVNTTKSRLESLKSSILNATSQAVALKAAYQREIADLQSQISVLKSRIEAQEKELAAKEKEMEQEKQNPFAEGETATGGAAKASEEAAPELKLANMYAVMEIRGQNGELIAKLINQDGEPFFVKRGTMLQSGHIIDEITSTYVRAEKGGIKDYLYFAAGGILPLEPAKSEITSSLKEELKKTTKETKRPARTFVTSSEVPGMGRDMVVR